MATRSFTTMVFNVASVIFDPEKVNQIYVRTLPAFRTSDLLAHATEQLEFYQHGYRTDFYTKDNFQFLLTHGFEYLLPQDRRSHWLH